MKRPSFTDNLNGGMVKGMTRTGSQIFLMTQKSKTRITQRGIFWVWLVFTLGLLGAALAIIILFFKHDQDILNSSEGVYGDTGTAPPTSWGTDAGGHPCGFGGCTATPTFPPNVPTNSPTMSGRL